MTAKVNKIGTNDVLLGKGPRISHNPGNVKYRAYCDMRRAQFRQLGSKGKKKKKYCMAILEHIKSIGGRFIRYDKTTESLYEVEDSEACKCIAKRLREPHESKCIKPSLPPPTFATATTNNNNRSKGIKCIGPKDVLMGRGVNFNKNKGNIRFRDYCYSVSEKYGSLCNVGKYNLTNQMVQDMLSAGWRFLAYNNKVGAWFKVEHSEIRIKIAQRLRESMCIDPTEGIMSSRLLRGFLQEHPHLDKNIKNVFSNCLNYPSKQPTVPGSTGFNAKVIIGPYDPNNVAVNLDRGSTYIREEFGRDCGPGASRGGRDTLNMPCYGTGKGFTTHGTSVWPFNNDMCTIADAVKTYIENHIDNEDNSVKFREFNMCTLICYEGERSIKPHRDNVYGKDGTWNDADNCQVQHTPVATLVYGDTRELHFQLYRHRDASKFPGDACIPGKGPIKVGDPITFKLQHGDVFYLDPKTEELRWRRHYFPHAKTFFKHSCNGVEGYKGLLSLGLVFRVGKNFREVYADTGMLRLTDEEEKRGKMNHSDKIRKSRSSVVEKCMNDFLQSESKVEGDDRRKQLWTGVNNKY